MLLNWLKDLIYPKYCLSCGSFGSYLCSSCLSRQLQTESLICAQCQRPAIDGVTHLDCHTRWGLDGVISFWQNKGAIKNLLKVLKYQGWFDMKDELTDLVKTGKKSLTNNIGFSSFCQLQPLVLAVPLHSIRRQERGFNQSEIMARIIAAEFNLKLVDNLLIRSKNTPHQAGLPRRQRMTNIRRSFKINPRVNKNEIKNFVNILLVDDIWTTGATLRECTRTLKKAGVKKVWALTMAY